MYLTHKKIKTLSALYLALPVLIFAAGYLKWYLALPAVLCMLLGFWYARRPNETDVFCRELQISSVHLIVLAAVILLWTWLGGLNGLFYQSNDWPWRNAIYHDIIDERWPVIYPEEQRAGLLYRLLAAPGPARQADRSSDGQSGSCMTRRSGRPVALVRSRPLSDRA